MRRLPTLFLALAAVVVATSFAQPTFSREYVPLDEDIPVHTQSTTSDGDDNCWDAAVNTFTAGETIPAGNLEVSNDVDWALIQVPASAEGFGGQLTVTLAVPDGVDYTLELYDDNCGYLDYADLWSDGGDEELTRDVEPGNYRVRIAGYSSDDYGKQYQLSTSYTPINDNTCSNAYLNTLDADTMNINGNLEYDGDVDWALIEVDHSIAMRPRLIVPDGVDYDMEIYTGNCSTRLFHGYSSGDVDEEGYIEVQEGQTYAVKIYGYGSFHGEEYTLSLPLELRVKQYINADGDIYTSGIDGSTRHEPEASGEFYQKIHRDTRDFEKFLVRNDDTRITFKNEEGTDADRYMMQTVIDELNDLVPLADAEGMRLRITEAWDEDGEHSNTSLHYEGRALDMTTDPKNTKQLGRLAWLAHKAGFDWSWYETDVEPYAHVHVSEQSFDATERACDGLIDGNEQSLGVLGERGIYRRLMSTEQGFGREHDYQTVTQDPNPDLRFLCTSTGWVACCPEGVDDCGWEQTHEVTEGTVYGDWRCEYDPEPCEDNGDGTYTCDGQVVNSTELDDADIEKMNRYRWVQNSTPASQPTSQPTSTGGSGGGSSCRVAKDSPGSHARQSMACQPW